MESRTTYLSKHLFGQANSIESLLQLRAQLQETDNCKKKLPITRNFGPLLYLGSSQR
jgi:hypothetical protein